MDSKQVVDNGMLEEFVALYLGEKDKKLEQSFREKLGVSTFKLPLTSLRLKKPEFTISLSLARWKKLATLPCEISKLL